MEAKLQNFRSPGRAEVRIFSREDKTEVREQNLRSLAVKLEVRKQNFISLTDPYPTDCHCQC